MKQAVLASDRLLCKELIRLRNLERACFVSKQRYAFYDYLAAVYNLHRRLRRRKAAKKAACRIAALYNLSLRKDVHPMRAIIDAGSDADRKTRSRWMRALQYAWQERHTWEDFRGFLRDHGGVAGCARDFAAVQPGPPRGFVAFGGVDRRPRVPLCVDKQLLLPMMSATNNAAA